jgi:D,D-heptose 1,7-bisphosphate phosphatase
VNKAVFFDRDGTINKEVNYLTRSEDIKFMPGLFDALEMLKKAGFLNIIITNQSAVARGLLSVKELESIHREFLERINLENKILIDDIFYSPYHVDGVIEKYKIEHNDRKPGIGLIEKAAEKYKINLEESFFVGDSYTDMKCASNAKLKKVMMMTGYGKRDIEKCRSEKINIESIAGDLLEAVAFIVNNSVLNN